MSSACPASVEHPTSLACSMTSFYHGPSQLPSMPTRGLEGGSCSCESCPVRRADAQPSFTCVGLETAQHGQHGTGNSTEGTIAHISKVLVNISAVHPSKHRALHQHLGGGGRRIRNSKSSWQPSEFQAGSSSVTERTSRKARKEFLLFLKEQALAWTSWIP